MGGDEVVATVFSDDNKKYLSTDHFRDEPWRRNIGRSPLIQNEDLLSTRSRKAAVRAMMSG